MGCVCADWPTEFPVKSDSNNYASIEDPLNPLLKDAQAYSSHGWISNFLSIILLNPTVKLEAKINKGTGEIRSSSYYLLEENVSLKETYLIGARLFTRPVKVVLTVATTGLFPQSPPESTDLLPGYSTVIQ